jgi:hypothetical protein
VPKAKEENWSVKKFLLLSVNILSEKGIYKNRHKSLICIVLHLYFINYAFINQVVLHFKGKLNDY